MNIEYIPVSDIVACHAPGILQPLAFRPEACAAGYWWHYTRIVAVHDVI